MRFHIVKRVSAEIALYNLHPPLYDLSHNVEVIPARRMCSGVVAYICVSDYESGQRDVVQVMPHLQASE